MRYNEHAQVAYGCWQKEVAGKLAMEALEVNMNFDIDWWFSTYRTSDCKSEKVFISSYNIFDLIKNGGIWLVVRELHQSPVVFP